MRAVTRLLPPCRTGKQDVYGWVRCRSVLRSGLSVCSHPGART